MLSRTAGDVILALAALPFIYYLLAIYSTHQFFRRAPAKTEPFTPPVSILKPVRGLDPDAYENFASFCRQDYPDYEILFCLASPADPALPTLERLQRDFPTRRIRVIFQDAADGTSATDAPNDKVSKLARLTAEAQHEILVFSDSDVRVRSDYLRQVVAPLADSRVGAVTCPYLAAEERTFADRLQTVGMVSDFYAGLFVARQLDGVKFALGQTIATRRALLAGFGGFAALQNRPADDLLVGRLVAAQGYRVELLPYTVSVVADFRSLRDLWAKRLRWLTVMRHMRPWGHLGLLLTQALPWSLLAIAIHPTPATAIAFLGMYVLLRAMMTWQIGVKGLRQSGMWQKFPLIPFWDAFAFGLWLASFFRSRLRWRDTEFHIRQGKLVPLASREWTVTAEPVPASPEAVPQTGPKPGGLST